MKTLSNHFMQICINKDDLSKRIPHSSLLWILPPPLYQFAQLIISCYIALIQQQPISDKSEKRI
jgi:hypothetical protein